MAAEGHAEKSTHAMETRKVKSEAKNGLKQAITPKDMCPVTYFIHKFPSLSSEAIKLENHQWTKLSEPSRPFNMGAFVEQSISKPHQSMPVDSHYIHPVRAEAMGVLQSQWDLF